MPFICCSFRSQEEDKHDVIWPFSSTSTRKPTRTRRIFGTRSNKNATNAYADHGLDKFEALLADLDKKRQKILTQIGSSEDVSLQVKFIYRSHNELKPIVIKLQDQRIKDHNSASLLSTLEPDHHHKNVSFMKRNNIGGDEAEGENTKPVFDEKIRSDQCKRKIGEWWKPRYNFPLFVTLILLLLMFSGRSFAILCTCIGWYLLPTINETLHISKRSNNITKKQKLRLSRLR